MFPGKNQKIVCTIEARMSSSRLPGKVLMPLAGEPALQRIVERIRRSKNIDEVVVATTENISDQPIIDLCNKISCSYFRGSENDVLRRVLDAAKLFNGDIIIEITGDCPLIDHRHIDAVVELFYSGEYDYAANCIVPSFPEGFAVQVFPTKILEEVDKLTDDYIDRIHVSYYIYNHPERYRLIEWKAKGYMYWPELALTLDEEDDYVLLNKIFNEFFPGNQDFSSEDVVSLLRKRPDIVAINAGVRRKKPQEG